MNGELFFVLDVPVKYRLEIEYDETDNNIIASGIPQEILEYLSKKLNELSIKTKVEYNNDIIKSYINANNSLADLFISVRVLFKESDPNSWAAVQYFKSNDYFSVSLGNSIVYRLNKIMNNGKPLFEKALIKEEDIPHPAEKSIPSSILALCLGFNALSVYNLNKDYFIETITNVLLNSIMDCLDTEMSNEIDLSEFAD